MYGNFKSPVQREGPKEWRPLVYICSPFSGDVEANTENARRYSRFAVDSSASAGYINNIENGINFPSMTMFFYICDYLENTPKDFFDSDTDNPVKLIELSAAAKVLTDEQLDHLIAIAKGLHK